MSTSRGPLPPVYFFGSLVVSALLHWLMPIVLLLSSSPLRWTGLFLLLVGIVCVVLPAKKFDDVGTTIKPFQASTTLITDGLFGYTRNPMYLGMVLILLGVDVILGSLSPFVVVPLFMIVIDRRFIRSEELALRAVFGERYQSYRARVSKWL